MRISGNTITSRLVQQVQFSRRRLFEVQERVGTGRRINRPADDPAGASRLMRLRAELGRNAQYQRNVDSARARLTVAETTLGSMTGLLQRVSELSVQAANGAIGASERMDISHEVAQLLEQALSLGNATHAGQYVFAGHQTQAAPFVPDVPSLPTAIAYVGDGGTVEREIAAAERVAVNITGDRVFPDIFATLISFRDALRTNDTAGITQSVGDINVRLDDVLALRSEVGSKMRRVDLAEERLLDAAAMSEELIAGEEEVDLAETLVDLSARETALQAALGAAGRALNLSLMEFLR